MKRLLIASLQRFELLDNAFALRRRFRQIRDDRRARRTRRAFDRIGATPDDGHDVVRVTQGWFVARTVSSVRVTEVRDANFAKLARICAEADLDYFVVPTGSVFRTAIAVPASQQARAIDAIARSGHDCNWYVSSSTETFGLRPFVHLDVDRWQEWSVAAPSIETYSVVSSEDGKGVIGREYCCELQFWTVGDADDDVGTDEQSGVVGSPTTLVQPPRRNPFLNSMPLSRAFEASLVIAGHEHPTAPEFQWYAAGASCPFEIDVVYTWVDGNDAQWRKRRSQAAVGPAIASADGSSNERFRTFDELRYSLRSLWQYVPFVRTIFIVTDQQIPSWLDAGHEHIKIVDHREIFDDPSVLPTFNSHSIETQLHHIEGLRENYLYLNDDVFFGRLADWRTYFDRSGRSNFFESKATFAAGDPSPGDSSVDNAGKNLQRELFRETGWSPWRKIKHTPHAQQRSLMYEVEERFGSAYAATRDARFRSTTDVSFAVALHHRYGQAVGRTQVGSIRYDYLNLALQNLPDRLEDLRRVPLDTFCLNDGSIDDDHFPAVHEAVCAFLRERFPYSAPWESDVRSRLRSHAA